MRAGGGKSKGAAYERKVCERLSKWMTRGLRDDLYWRSAMSGGRATVKRKKGQKNETQLGDISAIDPLGEPLTRKFFCECKFYADLKLHGMYVQTVASNPMGGIAAFWEKAVQEATDNNRHPMLIAKQNNFPEIILLSLEGIDLLGLDGNDLWHAVFPQAAGGAVMLYFDTFLKHAKRLR